MKIEFTEKIGYNGIKIIEGKMKSETLQMSIANNPEISIDYTSLAKLNIKYNLKERLLSEIFEMESNEVIDILLRTLPFINDRGTADSVIYLIEKLKKWKRS